MQNLWSRIGSPRNLIVFDAAARHGSFTRAAEELNVQQPSVSAAIKQLEAALGVYLFRRSHRRVELTEAGERLYSDVSKALSAIEQSLDTIQKMGRAGHVTLNASSAFCYYWLVPRLHSLHDRHPRIDLRMQISNREPDPDSENIDLAIRLGNGNWPGCDAVWIADEVIFPVASPPVMAAASGLRTIPDLVNQRLIHLEEPVRIRPTWAQWFAHHGVPARDIAAGLRLNDYALVLQSAVAGEGFAFGWEHVVRGLIDQRLLTGREDWAWRTGNGFFVVWSRRRTLSADAARVRDWIVDVSAPG